MDGRQGAHLGDADVDRLAGQGTAEEGDVGVIPAGGVAQGGLPVEGPRLAGDIGRRVAQALDRGSGPFQDAFRDDDAILVGLEAID